MTLLTEPASCPALFPTVPVRCQRPAGHEGDHADGWLHWRHFDWCAALCGEDGCGTCTCGGAA
mgnify:CR=1 FL=1